MSYYYLHPLKPQYFFPKDFKKIKLFSNFFIAYSLTGKISWFLFSYFGFYRFFFQKSKIDFFVPEERIRSFIGHDALMAFNIGNPGPEQKITGLGIDNEDEFFIKYGQTDFSYESICNEYFILKQLSELSFIPKVLGFYEKDKCVLLKTSVLKGKRIQNINLDKEVLNKLFSISNLKIKGKNNSSFDLKTCFAHGDFCPWNMMYSNNDILIYDWEMAGYYTLGYDLFTFIFQTKFLLEPQKKIADIIKENIILINEYFLNFEISDWKVFLLAFAEEKIKSKTKIGNKRMQVMYKQLFNYASKI